MASTEQDTSSPRGGPLARLRRNKERSSDSSVSLSRSTTNDDDVEGKSRRIRSSIDEGIKKVKERTKRSNDDRRGSDDPAKRGLSALLARKKRNSKGDILDVERNMSTGSGALSTSGNRSESSLLGGSGHSSILTDDYSDTEGYVEFISTLHVSGHTCNTAVRPART